MINANFTVVIVDTFCFNVSRSSCTKIQQLQKTSVELTDTKKTNELQKADDNESYKQQLLNHLDKKVEEKSK